MKSTPDSEPVLPRLQRPTRELAVQYARRVFLHGERVDMRTLAAALDVGRSTLYRWVGDREALLAMILAEFSAETWQTVSEGSASGGVPGALADIRRFMQVTSGNGPLRQFAEQEPTVALRVLMAEAGQVNAALRAGVTACLTAHGVNGIDARTVEIVVQLGTALQWTPIVIGEPPAIDRAITLIQHLLDEPASPRRP
ncbi:QsdR family transcriptional regulator [Streptomyces sp. 142MFCol3.1]|uniref:QsdR family transcriptional regulator n=1 Tax=Streptomyces sp. 142MFCol3.1 TaxID=1172179 RepID=UPI0006863E60|nr:QsdR family transcriptional regulator [Streptomyces sp. 142MFCol3.1]